MSACRAFQISEERGNSFTFTVYCSARFHRRLFGPDTLGEVGRGVAGGGLVGGTVETCWSVRERPPRRHSK